MPSNTWHMIEAAADVLRRESPPGSLVYLFGSQARGDVDETSDIDCLVVEPSVEDSIAEMSRLSHALRWLRIFYDLVVLRKVSFDEWRDVPCSLPNEVLREGKLLHAS